MRLRIAFGAWMVAFVVVVSACSDPAPEPDASRDDAGGSCVGDDACSDGLFCNGEERCDPTSPEADARGCTRARGAPCLATRLCIERDGVCRTDCGVERDADGDGVDAIECGGADCDDGDPERFPGNPEICDGADHDEDCDPTTYGARDLDRDTFDDAACCNVAADGTRTCGEDCDDTRRSTSPIAPEVCDGLDGDCDGVVDEMVDLAGFEDRDRDLHGDPARPMRACAGAVGFSTLGDDCDDTTPARHAAQVEICDGLDNDCDMRMDEATRPVSWYRDLDGDGFGRASSGVVVSCEPVAGHSLLPTDCDDTNRGRSPAAPEVCNGLDDDCNGLADYRIGPNDLEDDDGDGAADIACGGFGVDCDDRDPAAYPGAPELCDHRDNDCDGIADHGEGASTGDPTAEAEWLVDTDGDSWGADGSPIRSCARQPGRAPRGGDCADADPTRHPRAPDRCDGIDDDCDGRIDEDAVELAFYSDADGDGSGDGSPVLACAPPPASVLLPGDCAPDDATRGPDLPEACNSIDDDCDGRIDEGQYIDRDGDGRGDPAGRVDTCTPGTVAFGDDCDDTDPLRSPGRLEECDGDDDDCDGVIDEGAVATSCASVGGTATCTGGRCVFACDAGRGDCDGDGTNGCEAVLATDPDNCGACGDECGIAARCTAGACDAIVDVQVGSAYLGGGHACALRAGGGVLCWGENTYGQSGSDSSISAVSPLAVASVRDAQSICAGGWYTCARRRGGEVWCWGWGGDGVLGQGTGGVTSHVPVRVPGISDAVEIACSHVAACARRASGRVTCWGNGSGTITPHDLPAVGDATWLVMTRTDDALMVGTASGRVVGWGTFNDGDTPDHVTDYTARFPGTVTTAALGTNAGCAIVAGELWCWGYATPPFTGEPGLALGTTPRRVSATVWAGAQELAVVGDYAMCARLADGRVTCSGAGDPGFGHCLRGDGCGSGSGVANGTFVPGITDATRIRAGGGVFCVLRASGHVECWGPGPHGDGTMGNASTPRRAITGD